VDAARLLTLLRPELERAEARWALAGGMAINAYGSARMTYDMDLAVEGVARTQLVGAVARLGFEVLRDSTAFTNFLHPDPELGRLDMIWLDAVTSRVLFANVVTRTGVDGRPLLVVGPHQMIAMKLHAISNQPTRVFRDGADLQALVALPEVEENDARAIFARYNLAELYDRIKNGL
jgi:nucleotidyltransferase AbiEii toxin of type IV toxin-antitoxin system